MITGDRVREVMKAKPAGYWSSELNQPKFFCDLAADLGFDPFAAENWTKVTPKQVKDKVTTGYYFLKRLNIHSAFCSLIPPYS